MVVLMKANALAERYLFFKFCVGEESWRGVGKGGSDRNCFDMSSLSSSSAHGSSDKTC